MTGSDAESPAAPEAKSDSADWSFPAQKKGMATETKVGLALVVFLIAAFGFVVWKKMHQRSAAVAATFEEPAGEDVGDAPPATNGDAVSYSDRPEEGDFTASKPASDPAVERQPPEEFEPEATWGESDEVVAQREPAASSDPFAEVDPPRRVRDAATPRPSDEEFEFEDAPDQGSPREVEDFERPPTVQDDTFADREALPADDGFGEPREATFEDAAPIRQTMAENDESGDAGAFPEDDGFDFDGEPAATPQPEPERGDPFAEDREDPFSEPESGSPESGSTVESPRQDDGFTASSTARTRVVQQNETAQDDPFADDSDFPEDAAPVEPTAPEPDADAFGDGFEPIPQRGSATGPAEPADPLADSADDPFGGSVPAYEQEPPETVSVEQRGAGDSFGDERFSPSPTDAAGHAPGTRLHEVKSGESYWTISREEYGTARYYTALAKYNEHRIPNPKRMRPGMKVLIPPADVLHQRYPKLCGSKPATRTAAHSGTAPKQGELLTDHDGGPAYRVGSKDTLSEIAHRHLGRASRWIQIYEMNRDRLQSPGDLPIGTVLRLPGDASRVSVATEPVERR